MKRVKRFVLAATITLGAGGGAVLATASDAHAASMTPATLCTVVRDGTLVQRPCTFSEWWYLRFYA